MARTLTDRSEESRMDGSRARIALINDDTTFLELMRDPLQEVEGYEVLICKEGDQAYELVRAQQPNLIILDIRMGGEESGWTLLELLTLDPQTRPIPLIVCSAAIRNLQDHEPLLQRFGIGVLPKPFDLEVLLGKIEAALSDGGPRGGGSAPGQ
jgi:DNA-binding response OmpR family regulator